MVVVGGEDHSYVAVMSVEGEYFCDIRWYWFEISVVLA